MHNLYRQTRSNPATQSYRVLKMGQPVALKNVLLVQSGVAMRNTIFYKIWQKQERKENSQLEQKQS